MTREAAYHFLKTNAFETKFILNKMHPFNYKV